MTATNPILYTLTLTTDIISQQPISITITAKITIITAHIILITTITEIMEMGITEVITIMGITTMHRAGGL